jgi:hypothetical protein
LRPRPCAEYAPWPMASHTRRLWSFHSHRRCQPREQERDRVAKCGDAKSHGRSKTWIGSLAAYRGVAAHGSTPPSRPCGSGPEQPASSLWLALSYATLVEHCSDCVYILLYYHGPVLHGHVCSPGDHRGLLEHVRAFTRVRTRSGCCARTRCCVIAQAELDACGPTSPLHVCQSHAQWCLIETARLTLRLIKRLARYEAGPESL